MRILVDVFDGTARQGSGPLTTCQEARVTRALDGAGKLQMTFPLTDGSARSLLQNEASVTVYVEDETSQGERLREFGKGVIRERSPKVNESGMVFAVSGPDSLDALTRRTVRLNRQYTNQAISAIASDLIGLVPGWSVVTEANAGAALQTSRFAGASVLKCLIRTAQEKGYHLREYAAAANTVEIGEFGTQTDIVIANVENVARELYGNRNLILIDQLEEKESTRELVNRVYPLGAGEGQAALTLKASTRTSPYTIKSVTEPDGSVVYYLEDETSQALYGVIEKVVTFKEIAPIANSSTAKQLAANALYDAAAAWLKRASVAQRVYKVSGVKASERVQPGDKVRIAYRGEVFQNNVAVDVLDVDDWFWVLDVTERAADSGLSIDLSVSLVDKIPLDPVGALVDGLEAISVRNVAIQTFPVAFPTVAYDTVKAAELPPPFDYGPGFNRGKRARLDLRINSFITDVTRVELRIVTFPLHLPARTYTPSPGEYYMFWDVVTSPNYPQGLRLRINDVDVTTALGGPWNDGINAVADFTVDISPYIVDAAGGLYQNHKVEIESTRPTSNGEDRIASPDPSVSSLNVSEGYVLMTATVLGVAQAILPS